MRPVTTLLILAAALAALIAAAYLIDGSDQDGRRLPDVSFTTEFRS